MKHYIILALFGLTLGVALVGTAKALTEFNDLVRTVNKVNIH